MRATLTVLTVAKQVAARSWMCRTYRRWCRPSYDPHHPILTSHVCVCAMCASCVCHVCYVAVHPPPLGTHRCSYLDTPGNTPGTHTTTGAAILSPGLRPERLELGDIESNAAGGSPGSNSLDTGMDGGGDRRPTPLVPPVSPYADGSNSGSDAAHSFCGSSDEDGG